MIQGPTNILKSHQSSTCQQYVKYAGAESLGIDFYSGYRKKKKIQVYTFIVASGEKNTRGGVQFEILKNPGIHFYSGFRGNTQVGIDFYSGFRKKSRYILL